MIPDKSRPEWRMIITGKIKPELASFSLIHKINSLVKQYKTRQINLDQAIYELYEMCRKYEPIYRKDLKLIFDSYSKQTRMRVNK